ncbi:MULTISPECIES: response regulator [unclassified Halomonas]|uniref:response regulator n=1 Tax=unclassified Halomonas TaxID=2609666 RepID=UPI002076705F|nr:MULTISPECIES: response regulator [unclassified Halomonas]
MRILVVDDDALSAELTAAIVASRQHVPIIAHNAMEAVLSLEAEPEIALIISDLNMPLVSGLELYTMLCEQGVTLPFILLTGDDAGPMPGNTPGLRACLQKRADLAFTLGEAVDQALSG